MYLQNSENVRESEEGRVTVILTFDSVCLHLARVKRKIEDTCC